MKALSRAVIHNFFPVKRLPGTPLPVVRTSNPMLSDSSIRRLMRQRNFPQRCRNQNAGLDGPMSRARLALRGRHRFPIGFSFFKHPKARLRKVASHGHFGFAMAAARFNPLVKSADMIVATALAIENRAVGSFHKGPLQIHIDISTNRSVVKFPPAGVLTRHQPAVASKLLSTGETLHSPNLGPNHHCQDISHSRQTLKQVCFSAWSESLHHQFRQPCINQLRFSSSLLNLIHYPIPVPHRLHRHRRLSFPPANKVLNAPMSVLQSTLVQLFSLCILYPCPGVLLVNIQCDVFHNCSPPRSLIVTTAVTEYLAFILIRMTFALFRHLHIASSPGNTRSLNGQ